MTEFTSSLQRAAAIPTTTNPTTTTTTTSTPNTEPKATKTGKFESSFHGLDLSEFGNTTTTTTSSSSTTKPGQPSASSQLLKRITLESEQILANETEEAILFEQARNVASKREEALRIQKANEAEKNRNGVGKDAELYSALVSMHSGDWNGGKAENRRRMVGGGGGVKGGGGSGKKRHAVKRVRRSKCRLGKK